MLDRKLLVFLCHASQDKPTVRELYKRLGAEGWMKKSSSRDRIGIWKLRKRWKQQMQ